MSIYLDAFWQCFRIPKPPSTEVNLPDQNGRVFIVTGGYAGCGKELAKILYSKNGTVYVAGRSKDKADTAIEEIKKAYPNSDGRVTFLYLDLADLASIKASANDFMGQERRLDVLTNNAGIMTPPTGTKSAQGYEVQMGTNCLGAFLFTQLLTPVLQRTAASSPPGSVRVTWAASLATLGSPKGGVAFDNKTNAPKVHNNPGLDYGQSKAGNVLLAQEYQEHHPYDGIVSNAWNPGNLDSELMRHHNSIMRTAFRWLLLYPAVYGAYTELWAGWSEEAGKEDMKPGYVAPWGRKGMVREDLAESVNQKRFWEWCERETEPYL